MDESFVVGGPVGDSELLLCHGMVCVVGRMRDLILQLSKKFDLFNKAPTELKNIFSQINTQKYDIHGDSPGEHISYS